MHVLSIFVCAEIVKRISEREQKCQQKLSYTVIAASLEQTWGTQTYIVLCCASFDEDVVEFTCTPKKDRERQNVCCRRNAHQNMSNQKNLFRLFCKHKGETDYYLDKRENGYGCSTEH